MHILLLKDNLCICQLSCFQSKQLEDGALINGRNNVVSKMSSCSVKIVFVLKLFMYVKGYY